MSAALTFRHASERDGRALVLTLIPQWKAWLLKRVLGIDAWPITRR